MAGYDLPRRLAAEALGTALLVATITAAYWFTALTSFANPAVAIARSLTDTFSGIRPLDLPGFIAAPLAGALVGVALTNWLLRGPAGYVAGIKAEAQL